MNLIFQRAALHVKRPRRTTELGRLAMDARSARTSRITGLPPVTLISNSARPATPAHAIFSYSLCRLVYGFEAFAIPTKRVLEFMDQFYHERVQFFRGLQAVESCRNLVLKTDAPSLFEICQTMRHPANSTRFSAHSF